MRIIGFTGPKGSGKDTAAKTLFRHNEGYRKQLFERRPMAEGVKNVCAEFFGWTAEQMDDFEFKETKTEFWPGGPVLEPRWPMMDIANYLRDLYGGEIHAERWARRVSQAEESKARDNGLGWGAYVTTDLRFPEELKTFQRLAGNDGLLVLYVDRQEAEEALSIKLAQGDSMAQNPSESHYKFLREYADINGAVIPNNHFIENLSNEVNNAVKNKFGHWQYWEDAAPLVTAEDLLLKLRTGEM